MNRTLLRLVLPAICLTLAVAFPISPASAQDMGSGPATFIKQGKFHVGLNGGFVFKRQYKDYDLSRDFSTGQSDQEAKEAKMTDDFWTMVNFTYGLTDWLNLTAGLGYAGGGKWHETDIGTGDEWRAKLKGALVWGGGLKADLWQHESGFGLAAGASYHRYDNRDLHDWENTTQGYSASDYWSTDDQIDFWQVDVNLVAYWRYQNFTPYVGAGWSYYRFNLSGRWTLTDDESQYIDYDGASTNNVPVSALVGFDFQIAPNMSAGLRAVLASRSEIWFGVGYQF